MADLSTTNLVNLTGGLWRDPLHTTCVNGATKYTLPMVLERPVARDANGRRPADFIDVVYYVNPGQTDLAATLTKGSQIQVGARLESVEYEKDGKKTYTWSPVAKEITYLSPKPKTVSAPVDYAQATAIAATYAQPIATPVQQTVAPICEQPTQPYQQPVAYSVPVFDPACAAQMTATAAAYGYYVS